jgi:ubiquinone/menaquinone biosynthesis C-methylase UbiE
VNGVTASHAALFDAEAARYDAAHQERSPAGHALRVRLAAVLELLGDQGGNVLDVGMGPGRLCAELARRGFRVSGVDASEQMVALARRQLPEAQGRLLQSDVERLPFPDASFDAVVATGVLEYLPDKEAAVQELSRVLRRGGRAVMSLPNVRAPFVLWRRGVFYPAVRYTKRVLPAGRPSPARRSRPPTASSFTRTLASAGLELETLRHTSYIALPSPLDELFPGPTVRIAERLEGSGPRLGALFASQILFSSRKAG